MLASNTSKTMWVAIALGVTLGFCGFTVALYPDAFSGITNVAKEQTKSNAKTSRDNTATDNLNVALSDGAYTVASSTNTGSAVKVGTGLTDYVSIANSKYSESQQLSLSQAVTADKLTADTAYVQNPDAGGIVWVLDGASPVTASKFNQSTGWSLDTSKVVDSNYYNVGVLVTYNDASGKQANGTYIRYQRIVNIKATGTQLKAWSALAIKENDGSDYSGVTNAISNQSVTDGNKSDVLANMIKNFKLNSDPTKWSASDKSSVINQMAGGLGSYSTTDFLGKTFPVLEQSSN